VVRQDEHESLELACPRWDPRSLVSFRNLLYDRPTYRTTISYPDIHLNQSEFEHLLELRTRLRRFLRWSEQQARAAGLTPAKHQLLLAIKGHPDAAGPTVGEIANYLVVRHQSAVGLIDRAVTDGLVRRTRDPRSKSAVRVTITQAGLEKLDALGTIHLHELTHLAPSVQTTWQALREADGDIGPDIGLAW
jgi:DNA-binding MarR family transcriptional regulator